MSIYERTTRIASLPTDPRGRLWFITSHFDDNNASLEKALEDLTSATYAHGGLVITPSLSIAGGSISVGPSVGVTPDRLAALSASSSQLSFANFTADGGYMLLLTPEPIEVSRGFTAPLLEDGVGGEAIAHMMMTSIGRYMIEPGSTPPTGTVLVAQLTRSAGAWTITSAEPAKALLREKRLVQVTGNYTLLQGDGILQVDAASNLSITLPNTVPIGYSFRALRIDSSSNTVAFTGGTIVGGGSLGAQWRQVVGHYAGANTWYVVALNAATGGGGDGDFDPSILDDYVQLVTYNAGISNLQGQIDDKASTAALNTAVNDLQGQIDGKVSTATFNTAVNNLEIADADLQTQINARVTTTTYDAGISNLQGQIDNKASTAALNSAVNDLEIVDADLQSQIDALSGGGGGGLTAEEVEEIAFEAGLIYGRA